MNDSDSLIEQLKFEKEAVEEELRNLKKQNETSSENVGKVQFYLRYFLLSENLLNLLLYNNLLFPTSSIHIW